MGRLLALGAVLFLILLLVVANRDDSDSTPTSKIAMTEDIRAELTASIQSTGYNCPAAKLAFAKGEGPRGTETQVYCGPANRDGVYEKLVYRVIMAPNTGDIWVEPWE